MASNTSQSKFSLKLMVHKEEKRVIFAEADSNFVDTLFSIMTFPMATIINLFCKCPKDNLNPMGSLNNLYKSLQNLSTNSFASEENKWLLLNPKTSSHEICRKVKLNLDDSEPRRYFICQDLDCTRRLGAPFSTCNLARCSYCGKIMNREITYAKSSGDQRRDQDGGAGVFVSEVTTFIVTDDLRVMPNSPGAIFELLGELGVTSVSCFEEKLFGIGHHQILDLLTGAQLFKNPLTYMVYPNSPFIQSSYDHRPETLVQHLTTKNDTPPKSTRFFKLKITMQKSTCKFLFAEAGSDFVEFLFGFLKIPLATMIEKLRTRSSSYECLKNLLSSISNMSVGECIKSHDRKPQLIATDFLLNRLTSVGIFCDSKSYNRSHKTKPSFSVIIPELVCGKKHEKEGVYYCCLRDSTVNGRYLKPSAKFILTDNLVITPLTSFSSITMLCNLKVPFNDVEVHIVNIGSEEVLEILEASSTYVSAFTDYILKRLIEKRN